MFIEKEMMSGDLMGLELGKWGGYERIGDYIQTGTRHGNLSLRFLARQRVVI